MVEEVLGELEVLAVELGLQELILSQEVRVGVERRLLLELREHRGRRLRLNGG